MEIYFQFITRKQYNMILKAEQIYKEMEPSVKHWIKLDEDGLLFAKLFVNKDKGIVVAKFDNENVLVKELNSIIGKATCNFSKDTFDVKIGIDIAVSKLALNITKYIHKQAMKKFDDLEERLHKIALEINKDYAKINEKLSKF